MILETNLDDMNPEGWQWVETKLFEAGALDVWRETIAMKKGRMGICLKVLCGLNAQETIEQIILTETTAIGLRSYEIDKTELERDFVIHEINSCKIQVKRVRFKGQLIKYKPEYEDVVAFAKENQLTLLDAQKMIQKDLEEEEKWKQL